MYIRPTFLPEVAKLPEATLPWDLPSGARPKAPAVIVPVFGPIRHSCVVLGHTRLREVSRRR